MRGLWRFYDSFTASCPALIVRVLCHFGFYSYFCGMTFPKLNLPSVELRLRQNSAGRTLVFDPLRRRFVTLTAEEWVRQHFVHFLMTDRGYPSALLGNEVGLTVGGVARRCDSVLFSRQGGEPRVIVEYKAPHIAISQEVFTQIQSYNSVLRADYLIVSNGLRHFCCRMDYSRHCATFLPHIPHYRDL